MELCDVSGKNEILQKCQGILHFNLMKLEYLVPMYLFTKFIKFSAPILSGKFEFVSGKYQGIVSEFWSVLNV